MIWLKNIVMMLVRFWGTKMAYTHLRRKGLLVYLRTLQAVRHSVIAAVAFVCVLQLMIIGLVGTFVVGVLLSSQETVTKLWILLGGFLLLLAVPLIALLVLLSERMWFKFSGADKYFSSHPVPHIEPSGQTTHA